MPLGRSARALIAAVGAAAIAFAMCYGPSRRIFAASPRAVAVPTAADACELWAREGIRGRVAIVFAKDLMPARSGLDDAVRLRAGRDADAISRAVRHGIVREVWHVVPDGDWREIALNLLHVTIYWDTERGLVGAFEDGRVNVVPFSRLPNNTEPALVIVDARDWSPRAVEEIAARIRMGVVAADLVTVLGASAEDVALLDFAVVAGWR